MKFNVNNTALHFLNGGPIDFTVPTDQKQRTLFEKESFRQSIIESFEEVRPLFAEKVQYISVPFYEAFMKSRHKLAGVFDKEEIETSGTFIVPGAHGTTNTYFYALKTELKGDLWWYSIMIMCFHKHKDMEKPSLDVMIYDGPEFSKEWIWEGHSADKMEWIANIICIIVFMKYCEVETKIIPPGRKEKHVGTKYVNETKHKIEILDSSWFTTLIKSDGFAVGGHFRFQPYGPGLSRKKLIWIEPFEKTGYTRTAKVERLHGTPNN